MIICLVNLFEFKFEFEFNVKAIFKTKVENQSILHDFNN